MSALFADYAHCLPKMDMKHIFSDHLLECVAIFTYCLCFPIGPASDAPTNTYMIYSVAYQQNSTDSSQSPPAMTYQPSSERIVYEEVGNRTQGNTYDFVDPCHNPESTIVDVPNPMYQATTLPGTKQAAHEDTQSSPERNRSTTLTEVSNPMYETAPLQENKEPEYQETQIEVENILYEDRLH